MAFALWDPIRDLLTIQQRLNRFAPGPCGWIPPIDVHETANEFVVTAELPGPRPQRRADSGWMTARFQISGQRRERDIPYEQYHRVERGHGSFNRTLDLPRPVDAERVTADLRDGVLTIVCPKTTEAAPRRIQVS